MVQPATNGARPSATSRMSLANVTSGKESKPIKMVLYGPEGVGKSTFGSEAPSPIFLCTEDGTSHLNVKRFPQARTWAEVLEAVRVLTHEEHPYQTLVIDTLDWLEPLCWKYVCSTGGKQSIEEFGYGKGYVAAIDQWRILLGALELLQRTRKTNVIALAHASAKNHKDPSQDAFQRWQLRLHASAGDLWKEWADCVFFAKHEVFTKKENSKVKGLSSGARNIHTEWTAHWDAKSRFALPASFPLSWEEFRSRALDPKALRAQADVLVPQLPEEKRSAAAQAVIDAGDDCNRLSALINRMSAVLHEKENQ